MSTDGELHGGEEGHAPSSLPIFFYYIYIYIQLENIYIFINKHLYIFFLKKKIA
jgi:hypothetical protein